MSNQSLITSDDAVLAGKPIVRGTRLSVEFLISLLAQGWSHERILSSYPQLTAESLAAAISFAVEAVHHEKIHPIRPSAA